MKKDYENLANIYCDRYGVRGATVKGNKMTYIDELPSETWKATVNLDTMKETRKQIK